MVAEGTIVASEEAAAVGGADMKVAVEVAAVAQAVVTAKRGLGLKFARYWSWRIVTG